MDYKERLTDVIEIEENDANEEFEKDKMVQIRIISDLDKNDTPGTEPNKDTLIIHVHGGGFIAMSSGSHQMQTRTWA